MFYKRGVLRNFTKFTGKHLRQRLFLIKLQKESLAQVFSCEFCEIFKNTFFYRTHLRWLVLKHVFPALIGSFFTIFIFSRFFYVFKLLFTTFYEKTIFLRQIHYERKASFPKIAAGRM